MDPTKCGVISRPNKNDDQFAKIRGNSPRELRRIYNGAFGNPSTEGAKTNAEYMRRGTKWDD
jgi:hypothetical protein